MSTPNRNSSKLAHKIRDIDKVTSFFGQTIHRAEPPAAPNWYHDFILADVRALFIESRNREIPSETTSYSLLLREKTQLAIKSLCQKDPHLKNHLKVVLISGLVAYGYAYPFHAFVEDKVLPKETTRLIRTIYNWLFTFLGKSSTLSNLRFLDEELTSTLKLRLFVTKSNSKLTAEDCKEMLKGELLTLCNFAPPLQCQIQPISEIDIDHILSSYCILGKDFVDSVLQQELDERRDEDFYHLYQKITCKIFEELSEPRIQANFSGEHGSRIDNAGAIIENFLKVQNDLDEMIYQDLTPTNLEKNNWHAKNEPFFKKIKQNDFDQLIVEDATKGLGDKKGFEKNNQYAISHVKGLKAADQFIPAFDMVLKLRGLTHYRGDINNYLDMLKEYTSYAFIFSKSPRNQPFFLNTGPLLLTCEKLAVPYGRQERQKWIGFFMEKLSLGNQEKAFTCRVHRISDFWIRDKVVTSVLEAAHTSGIQLDPAELAGKLEELAVWLWTFSLSIDYCDLVLFLDPQDRITRMRIIDLERLSFGELVNEEHVLLESLIDLKSRLRKKDWPAVLASAYISKERQAGLNSFADITAYLIPRGRKKTQTLKLLRSLKEISKLAGYEFGDKIWTRLIKTIVKTFSTKAAPT